MSAPTLFDGGELRWNLAEWGGVQLRIEPDKGRRAGRSAMLIAAGPVADDWSGVRIFPPNGGIELTPEIRRGNLVFYINSTMDEWGDQVGEQSMQISLNDAPYIHWGGMIEGGGVDRDPARWQKVIMPLSNWNLSDSTHLRQIAFQWHGKAPAGGVYVDELRVVPGE